MGQQLYRRLPQAFVVETLEAFNDHRMTERQACALLGLKRARLYQLRREWLRQRATWTLGTPQRARRGWSTALTDWLHTECRYLQAEAAYYRQRFNFAVLAEAAHQRFGEIISRNGVRRWAIRHGYYQQTRAEVQKVYIRWESAGPGALWHHDTSHHCWLPRRGGYQDLILTQDDYSRQIVGWRLEAQERLWDHLCLVRETLERWGRPLAYYVDEHGYFRWVARSSAWRRERLKTDEGAVQFRRVLQALDVRAGCSADRGRVRPVPEDLDLTLLFALQQERLVHSDGKVRFLGRTWSVSAPAGSRVIVCWRSDDQLVILWKDQKVGAYAF